MSRAGGSLRAWPSGTVRGVMHARAIPLLAFSLFLLFLSEFAYAASLRTEVSARRVGVGQPFSVQLTAVQGDQDPEPQSPSLKVQGQAEVQGPSIGSQRRVTMKNFDFQSESSVVATWTVVPLAKGKLVIGPGTFQVGGKVLRGETIVVEVVDAPQDPGPPPGRRSIFGPGSDPFNNFPSDLFSDRRPRVPSIPEAPPEFQVDKAPSPTAFLQAHLSKKQVVMGEPVRLTLVAYGALGNFREISPNGPALSDFLSYAVVESSHDEPAYQTTIQGQTYLVRKLREYILIPLKTGTLEVGEMTAVLMGNRGAYPSVGSPHGTLVTSPKQLLKVIETPEKGKPAGYFPGDVGRFNLQTTVTPSTVSQGEFVEVTVTITGQGQLPSKVLLPEGTGVVWDKPTSRGEPEVRDGELQGERVLKYSVQITAEEGELDLGEVTLPYFDERKGRYEIARASLGKVTVKRSQASPAPSSAEPESDQASPEPGQDADRALAQLAPRSQLGAFVPTPTRPLPLLLWWLLFGLPALIFASRPAYLGVKKLQHKVQRGSEQSSKGPLKEAARLQESGDLGGALKLLERAVHEALTRATGLRARGILQADLARELRAAKVNEDLVSDVATFFKKAEEARYSDGAQEAAALHESARRICAQFENRKPVAPKGAGS